MIFKHNPLENGSFEKEVVRKIRPNLNEDLLFSLSFSHSCLDCRHRKQL